LLKIAIFTGTVLDWVPADLDYSDSTCIKLASF